MGCTTMQVPSLAAGAGRGATAHGRKLARAAMQAVEGAALRACHRGAAARGGARRVPAGQLREERGSGSVHMLGLCVCSAQGTRRGATGDDQGRGLVGKANTMKRAKTPAPWVSSAAQVLPAHASTSLKLH